jgi:hypothetical protein
MYDDDGMEEELDRPAKTVDLAVAAGDDDVESGLLRSLTYSSAFCCDRRVQGRSENAGGDSSRNAYPYNLGCRGFTLG